MEEYEASVACNSQDPHPWISKLVKLWDQVELQTFHVTIQGYSPY